MQGSFKHGPAIVGDERLSAEALSPRRLRELSRKEITAIQSRKLRAMAAALWEGNAFYRAKMEAAGVAPEDFQSIEALRLLPFTTKAELAVDQEAHPPYGTNLTYPMARYSRMHLTSGTTGRSLKWLDTPESWQWLLRCWEVIYFGAGIRPEDRFFFPFSFGPFIGFWVGFEEAVRFGNLTLAGGAMSTEARLRFMLENKATVVACTPTYALHLAEVAEQNGMDLAASAVRTIIVAGEPGGGIPETRRRIETAWGVRLFDHYGMTEIGALGFETVDHPGAMYLIETECIAEVVDPVTGEPVDPGRKGELILTNLGRTGSPLLRYRTGDFVRIDTEPSPGGWSLMKLRGGILGRVDDMVWIRGNNLYPGALESVLRRFEEIVEWRADVSASGGLAVLRLTIETAPDLGSNEGSLAGRVESAIREAFHFKPEVKRVEPGTLPRFELKASRFTIHPPYRKERS